MEYTDALGRRLIIRDYPQKIISLVPSITETLFAFHLADRILGVTDYCTYPRNLVSKKEHVGGTKKLNLDRVMALGPDLVFANMEENKKTQVEWLIDQGIRVYLTFPKTVEAAILTMSEIAMITGTIETAEDIIHAVQQEYARLRKLRLSRRPRVLCLVWKKPYMSLNADTFVNDMIVIAGGENVAAHKEDRYFRLDVSEIQSLSPEVILLPSEPYHFSEDDLDDFKDLEIDAVKTGQVYLVDGELITWHGPRLGQGLHRLHKIFSSCLSR